MDIHITVDDPDEAEVITDLVWEYIHNRNNAPSGINRYEHHSGVTIQETVSFGWQYIMWIGDKTVCTAYVPDRRSLTPGAADNAWAARRMAEAVASIPHGRPSPDVKPIGRLVADKNAAGDTVGFHNERPVDTTVRDILESVADPDCPTCQGSGIHGGPGGYYDSPGRGKPCGRCSQ